MAVIADVLMMLMNSDVANTDMSNTAMREPVVDFYIPEFHGPSEIGLLPLFQELCFLLSRQVLYYSQTYLKFRDTAPSADREPSKDCPVRLWMLVPLCGCGGTPLFRGGGTWRAPLRFKWP